MWKRSLALLCALAACDGSSPSSASNPAPQPISAKSLAGQTFVPTGPSMFAYNGYDSPTPGQATVQFVSATQINVNGIQLTQDPNDGVYRSADKSMQLAVNNTIDGLSTQQILYMLSTQTVNSSTTLTPLVVGNVTPASNIPQSGTATYAGRMTVYDDLGNASTMDGPVLVVSLSTADVTGGVTFANRFVALNPVKMTSGAFSTSMQSNEATPEVTGTIQGALFGSQGSEMGGTLSLEFSPGGTPASAYVGYYGATRQ